MTKPSRKRRSSTSAEEVPLGTVGQLLERYTKDLIAACKALQDRRDDGEDGSVRLDHVTKLLAAYTGTCTTSDQLVLYAIRACESQCGINLQRIAPVAIGPLAKHVYADLHRLGRSLYTRATTSQIIGAFDPKAMWASLMFLPLHTTNQKLADMVNEQSIVKEENGVVNGTKGNYDARYVLPLILDLLCHDYDDGGVDMRLIVERNVMAFVFASLSLYDDDLRALAHAILHKMMTKLATQPRAVRPPKGEEKVKRPADEFDPPQYLYLIRILRNSITKANQRINCLSAHFFARVSKLLLNPTDDVHPVVTAFLTLKPSLDIVDGSMNFLQMLHSRSVEHSNRERCWTLQLMSDALRSPTEYAVMEKRHVIEMMLMDMSSRWIDIRGRSHILRTIKNAAALPVVCPRLLDTHNVLTWMANESVSSRCTRWELGFLCDIASVVADHVLGEGDAKRNAVHRAQLGTTAHTLHTQLRKDNKDEVAVAWSKGVRAIVEQCK